MDFFKSISVRKENDTIEIKVRDSTYTPYFHGTARVNNRKEMRKLMEDLKNKGIELDSGFI